MQKLRNIAIIAHVDHGKTTLVDKMIMQSHVLRDNAKNSGELILDNNDLERERGITILSKNVSVIYKDCKINIIDTPGHADFGGEVERILKMVNGVILLVDAAEGPMPQTRFVLSRALELGHRVIVVVNKIDRPDQRIHEVVDEVLELLMDLDATPEQLDSPMLFCSGRNGTASYSPDVVGTDLKPLFDTILEYIPAPEADVDAPFQMLVSAIDYNEYVGRMAIGRIERGTLKQNQEIMVCNYHDPDAAPKKAKAVSMYEFEGLGKNPVTEYQIEAGYMFDELNHLIREDTVRRMYQLRIERTPERVQAAVRPVEGKPIVPGNGQPRQPKRVKPSERVGRNDPCPCGSGLKYKNCCGKDKETRE